MQNDCTDVSQQESKFVTLQNFAKYSTHSAFRGCLSSDIGLSEYTFRNIDMKFWDIYYAFALFLAADHRK